VVVATTRPVQRVVAAVTLAVALPLLGACSSDDTSSLSDELGRYTDSGDGCQQAVSAIAYADNSLRAAGQEQHQEFDDAVRSNIAAVAGTIALEVRDFPSKATLQQARTVADLADQTSAIATRGEKRVRLLREYRREAAQLVIDCAAEVDGL
jgi:ABC-type Fe3+-citrate transport system substrate-binding protein